MSDLQKWQLVSFMSRGLALALGLIQSFAIVRILTVGEWGLIQLAVSIGGALGVYQNLGLASGSTREISAAKDDDEIFKIFVTAFVVRYLINLPLAFFLFVFADKLSTSTYDNPELANLLKIYAFVLLIQGVQSIFNSIISGTKRFNTLFIYQIVIAIFSVLVYIPLVYFYKVTGYFYALFVFNLVSSLILGFLAFKPLKTKFPLPSKADFLMLFKELMSISLAIYLVKIVYTQWEKSGPILLGLSLDETLVGIFAFAALFAKKIVNVSDAITDVNLPVFSEKYVSNIDSFKTLFKDNFNKVFMFILACAVTASYWSKELVFIAVGSERFYDYLPSIDLIPILVLAFVLYSLLDIVKSSVLIPAKMTFEMIASFLSLLVVTVLSYLISASFMSNVWAMAMSMLLGTLICFILMNFFIYKKLSFRFIYHEHILLFIQIVFILFSFKTPELYIKLLLFIAYSLLFVWSLYIAKFIESPVYYLNKLKRS